MKEDNQMKNYVLFNSLAGGGKCEDDARMLATLLDGETEFINLLKIKNYQLFFSTLNGDDKLFLCGGDGTLNKFVNNTQGIDIKNDIYYFPCGTGNDFATDIGFSACSYPVKINEYIVNLPTVTVDNDITAKFINGVGYGIDGYCADEGERLRSLGKKKINYTNIAVKGLLFFYRPTNATVIIDDKEYFFKKVWLAPTMNGRYYGGGMMPAPNQRRLRDDKRVTLMIFHGAGKLRTLINFPSIFKGEHVNNQKIVKIFEGKKITVKFDRPTPLQIDGETIVNVREYTVEV